MLASAVWAFALVYYRDGKLLAAFATVNHRDEELFAALDLAADRRLSKFQVQKLAC